MDIIEFLKDNEFMNTLEYADLHNIDHQEIVRIVNSLASSEQVVKEQKSCERIELEKEGKDFIENGSHEYNVFKAVKADGSTIEELKKFNSVGFDKAKTFGWIEITPDKLVVKKVEDVIDEVTEDLKRIASGDTEIDDKKFKTYKSRKLLKRNKIAYFIVRKGPRYGISDDKIAILDEETITKLQSDFSNIEFKPFNLSIGGNLINNANLHPLLKVKQEYVEILTELGFQAMPTNRYVESSFWNFDALFQGQSHPARDAHDTFFVSDPEKTHNFPIEYQHRVKQVHSNGGYGSQGYHAPWHLEEAEKNIMRTHTTGVSARMLYQLAQQTEFKPVKYFSIDRVFRNETLDSTHLAEFHQVEGLIADRGLTLGHLQGIIYEFFRRLGLCNLKFKPAYNPYTEPSMEIFGFHPGLKKWIEVGNSGMFRPEMLLPMGLPEDVQVIAWGLSLERPTMIKYGLDNIRELLGPKLDLKSVYNAKICRL